MKTTTPVCTLLASAVLAALALPAMAEEVKPEFTVYGLIDVSVDYLNYSSLTGARESDLAVSSNSSRFGVKGEQALDTDLTLTYLLEWQVGASEESKGDSTTTTSDNANNNLSRRNQWIGVRTGFGEFRAGRIDTPLKILRGKVDLFYSDQLGESRTVTNASGFDTRADNSIYFDAGTGAVHGYFLYSTDLGSDAVDDNNNDSKSAAVSWESDAWFVGGGYESRRFVEGGLYGDADPAKDSSKALRVAAAFKFGEAYGQKVVAYFEDASNIKGTPGADRTTFGVGYSGKFGKETFKAAFYLADNIDNIANSGGNMLSLGWDHSFNKTTLMYVTAASVSNDDAATFKVVGVGHNGEITIAPGESNSGVAFGVRHSF